MDTMVGKRFGKWKVLEEYFYVMRDPRGCKGYIYYHLCECDCGKQELVRKNSLLNGKSKQCDNCRKKSCCTGYEEITGAYWSAFLNSAKKRGWRRKGIEVKLSKEEAWHLFLQQDRCCALTGIPLLLNKTKVGSTASIDRIDSGGIYELTNVQWVFKNINFMKQSFDQNYFIQLCKQVADYAEQKGVIAHAPTL